MTAKYTPTTAAIRKVYSAAPIITERNRLGDSDVARNALAFERWLAAHDADIRRDQAETDAAIAQRRIDIGYAWHPIITAEFPDNGQHIAAAIRTQFATSSPETEQGPTDG